MDSNDYESYQLGPFWITISAWDDEHVFIQVDISEQRLIDEVLPLSTTMEEAKRIVSERVAGLLAEWSEAVADWSPEWPTEIGHYFVYGYPRGKPHENAKPRLYTGEVVKIADDGRRAFIVGGRYAYKSEAARILVKRIETKLPEGFDE